MRLYSEHNRDFIFFPKLLIFSEEWLYSADLGIVETRPLPSELLPVVSPGRITASGLSEGAQHDFQCWLGEDASSMEWQPCFLPWVVTVLCPG